MILENTETPEKGQAHNMARDSQPYNIASCSSESPRSRKQLSSSLFDDDRSSLCVQADSITFFKFGGNARHIRHCRQTVFTSDDRPV